ncbi:MAG: BLUF domain-containing protein [Rhodothermales bacterium]
MIQYVYVSAAVELFSNEALVHLLRQCRENNERLSVTGLLLYKDGNFMQLLEGPEEAVDAVIARIGEDPRHRNVIPLIRRPVEERLFPTWAMGFKHMDELLETGESGVSTLLRSSLTAAEFYGKPDRAYKLLDSFRRVTAG